MCTPVGHTLAGASLLQVLEGRGAWRSSLPRLALLALAANLPDVDILFGLAAKRPVAYHHLWTHSLFFAVLAGGIILAAAFLLKKGIAWKLSIAVTALVLLHLICDLVTADRSAPYGMQIFWPFDWGFYLAPFSLFSDVVKSARPGEFWSSLFCRYNGLTVWREIVTLLPLFLFIFFIDKRGKRINWRSR